MRVDVSWGQRVATFFRPRNAGTIAVADPSWTLRQYLLAFEAGMTITVDEALKVSPVWCAMDTIVRSVAPCPWNVYDVRGGGRELRRDDSLNWILNTRANPWTTAIAFREALQWSALGYGNGYAEIQFDAAGRVAALWNLDPERVTPRLHPETGEFVYAVTPPVGSVTWVEPWRIFHLRGTSRTGYVGDNALGRAARSIATAAAAQQFAAAYFANGTVLSGYFSYGKVLDSATKETLEKDWAEKHSGGPAVKHKSPILPPGMEWKALASDPEKAQLIETRQFAVADVARWFGVPLHLLMDPQGSQGYGTNIEQSGIQFVNGCLHPWAERHEQEADFKLLPARPTTRETKIDLSRHQKGAFDTRAAGYATLKKAGVLNQNMILESEGWNTVGPKGDVFFVESTMVPVERAINPPEPPAPKPALPPAEEPEDPEEDPPSPAAVARVGIALDRFSRRMAARRADLEKNAPDKAGANLADERARIEPALLAECRTALGNASGLDMRVLLAADAVLAGEPPHLAAQRLVEAA
jgi:HK97 family phage portal protein